MKKKLRMLSIMNSKSFRIFFFKENLNQILIIIILMKTLNIINLARKMKHSNILLKLYLSLSLTRLLLIIDVDVIISLFYSKTNFIITSITLI